MEILTNAIATQALPLTTTDVAAANPSDAARFAELMHMPETAAAPTTPAVMPNLTTPAVAAGNPSNVGERILTGMQNISQEMQGKWNTVSQALQNEGNNFSMQEMLRLQMHLTQASVQYEVLGKAISKSTQNFDQLVRVQ